jgi:chitodextrinase
LEQTIYIPNNSDIDIFEHIDTKVAYEQEYTYEVDAVQVVIGSRYDYLAEHAVQVAFDARYDYLAELRLDDQARQTQNPVRVIDRPRSEPQMLLEVDVRIHPSVKIIEVPYFVAKAKVLDSAPLPPDVNIVPYRGINNKMLLLFNAQVGRIEEVPVSIQPEDDQLFEDYKQSRSITGENIIFEGDDEVESFEVFRTTRPPESYTDFRGLLHEVVATEPMGANFDASSAAFRDTIQPNTKYYYTFRARDVHGNVSNPTDVFQVEMVEEDGAVYPLIEVYNMVPEDPTEPTRKFKRFLYIKANPVHSTVTEIRQIKENDTLVEEEHTIFNPDTGTEPPFLHEAARTTSIGVGRGIAPALYGDSTRPGKFKFRIKSKKTGRKIDINLNFIHEIIDKL